MSQSLIRLRELGVRERALVLIATLLDGELGANYLQSDPEYGAAMSQTAQELSALDADLRIPLVGSLLRETLEQLRDPYTPQQSDSITEDLNEDAG